MSEKNTNMLIADTVKDPGFRETLYLDLSIEELITSMCSLQLSDIGDDELVPFFAKVRGYTGALDDDGASWLLKEISAAEGPEHKIQEIAFYIDFLLKTPAAPTVVYRHGETLYRATKQIPSAMQIGSYNYLQEPYIKMLANDLLNRWLFFDEDRNPNNYLIKHDTDGEPFIVVIDYNKADLETEGMKIFGLEDKFGWHREEKTRFLTLLKPDNFNALSIEDFDQRLTLMSSISREKIYDICLQVFSCSIFDDEKKVAEKITANVMYRMEYLVEYFRKWFTPRDTAKQQEVDDRYSGMGQSFLDYYKKKT